MANMKRDRVPGEFNLKKPSMLYDKPPKDTGPFISNEKLQTYRLRDRTGFRVPPSLQSSDHNMAGSLDRTPNSNPSKEKKSREKRADRGRMIDAYGHEISTVYDTDYSRDRDGLPYDERWPGVVRHVYNGVLVGAGAKKGRLMHYYVEARNRHFIGDMDKIPSPPATPPPPTAPSPPMSPSAEGK